MSNVVADFVRPEALLLHLTEEQFSECVLLAPSAASQAHLAHCKRCHEELAAFLRFRTTRVRREWEA